MKIRASNCDIVLISKQIERSFLDDNHYQGYVNSSVCYALKYESEIVMLMSFGTPRYSRIADFELLRLCTKKDYIVYGGASKLFKYFTKQNPNAVIVSYCNESKFNGDVYNVLEFKKMKITPSYHYEKDGKSYHRSNFQKHILVKQGYDASKTEREIMSERGFKRIEEIQATWVYDCVSKYYIYEIICNGFHYIGQHKYSKSSVDNYNGSGTIIKRLTAKYPYTKKILVKGIETADIANRLERAFILASRAKWGNKNVNILSGGQGEYVTHHFANPDETSRKLSKASLDNWKKQSYRDKIHPTPNRELLSQRSSEMWQDPKHYDKVFTEESNKKRSEARLGKEPWNKGKKCDYHTNGCKGYHHTDEAKRRISEAGKRRKGKHLTEETKRKLSELNKGKKYPSRYVYYSIDGEVKTRQEWLALGINVYKTPNAIKVKSQ